MGFNDKKGLVMKIHSPIYSVVQPKANSFASSSSSTHIYLKRIVQLLVNSFTHCVQVVLRAPNGSDGCLYHLKRAGLPGVSMDHAPNAGHHCRIPLRTNTATADGGGAGVACGGGLKRRRVVGRQAHKRCIHWRGGGCWGRSRERS